MPGITDADAPRWGDLPRHATSRASLASLASLIRPPPASLPGRQHPAESWVVPGAAAATPDRQPPTPNSRLRPLLFYIY